MTRMRSRLRLLLIALGAALGVAGLCATAAVAGIFVPAPPAHPTNSNQIQNVDQVKTAIKAYYGDTPSSVPDPVSGAATLHFASPSSAYAAEVEGIEAKAAQYLANPVRVHPNRAKAIVLDVDDTTLNTYSYEIYSNFAYNPTTNAAFVNAAIFPAVFGMPGLVNQAKNEGYAIFFLTGRPIAQLPGTQTNLTNAGYPVDPTKLYLKNTSASWLASCGGSACTTDQYKSLTRAHIESLGYEIVENFGDQFSDLSLGHEDVPIKVPNPMYFLP